MPGSWSSCRPRRSRARSISIPCPACRGRHSGWSSGTSYRSSGSQQGNSLGPVVLASANPDKARELGEILAGAGLTCAPPSTLPGSWQCEETGLTIEENALLKARAACALCGLPAIADDTGLFVAGLGGAPGVYTSRFAGPGCSYADNVRKLLRVLEWERGPARIACFRTAAAFASPSGASLVATGELSGTILEEPRGAGGFGYDPVFFVPALGCTLAECPAEVKNETSHRSRALRLLAGALSGGMR